MLVEVKEVEMLVKWSFVAFDADSERVTICMLVCSRSFVVFIQIASGLQSAC